jgi:Spherulation-specific family 4
VRLLWPSYFTIVSRYSKLKRSISIGISTGRLAILLQDSNRNCTLNVKIYWLLATSILISYTIGSTIFSETKDKMLEWQPDRIDLSQVQIASQSDRRSRLQILLPLYIYPNWYDKHNYIWKQVIAAAKKVPIVAIINPNNGPNNAPPNTDYQQGIRDLQQAGVKVIGYVPSNYANRNLKTVKADIDLYIKYFGVEGIFIDEAANTQDKLDYYHRIYRYIKSRSPQTTLQHQHDYTVIINPGMNIDEGYLSQPVADTIVVFENYQQAWAKYHPPTYLEKYSPQHFAALIHTTASQKLMKSTLDRAAKSKFGYVYITNDSTDTTNHNPWDTLPEYWQAEVNYIQQLNNAE